MPKKEKLHLISFSQIVWYFQNVSKATSNFLENIENFPIWSSLNFLTNYAENIKNLNIFQLFQKMRD